MFATVLLGAFLLALEVGFRLLAVPLGVPGADKLSRVRNVVSGTGEGAYEPDAHTSYRLRRTREDANSTGFRDDEFTVERPEGTLRIACLGGSTTYGHAVKHNAQTYPSQLESVLEQRLELDVDVQNWGIPSWTTAETLTNYFLNVQDFRPDVVILHHAMNDVEPRVRSDFRSDYSHYRTGHQSVKKQYSLPLRWAVHSSDLVAYGALRLLQRQTQHGINTRVAEESEWRELDPATEWPFRRNVITLCDHVRAQGGIPVLMTMAMRKDISGWVNKAAGCKVHNQTLRTLAAEHGYGLIDLERDWAADRTQFDPRFIDPVHVDARGCRLKAQWIADRLLELDLLPGWARSP